MAVVIREPKASVVLAVAFWSYLKLTVGTNAHKTAMKNIVDAIVYGNESFIVIGDDRSSVTEYITGITAVVSITVRGVNN